MSECNTPTTVPLETEEGCSQTLSDHGSDDLEVQFDEGENEENDMRFSAVYLKEESDLSPVPRCLSTPITKSEKPIGDNDTFRKQHSQKAIIEANENEEDESPFEIPTISVEGKAEPTVKLDGVNPALKDSVSEIDGKTYD